MRVLGGLLALKWHGLNAEVPRTSSCGLRRTGR